MDDSNYIYKAEVNKSLLMEGITLPVKNSVVFSRNMGHFLKRGESKDIILYLNGKGYKAKINNVNFSEKSNRKEDTFQIRYPKNGELSQSLQAIFFKSSNEIRIQSENEKEGKRPRYRVPEELREYLAIYTTQYEDSYVLEPIVLEDITYFNEVISGQSENILESIFENNFYDKSATVFSHEKIVKIRKLNKKIGENLKLLYDYRCQICGQLVGEKYDTKLVEAHHIDYFSKSLNNDSKNQLIVCPNHHSIIHDLNPVFDKKKRIYLYPNGMKEGLILNCHL